MNKFNIKLYKIDIFVFSSNVAGLDTKDIIAYSAASGSVIVIGIVAGLCIFYCLRRRCSYCLIISFLCSNLSNANDYVKFEK
jgi:hypothetical protein